MKEMVSDGDSDNESDTSEDDNTSRCVATERAMRSLGYSAPAHFRLHDYDLLLRYLCNAFGVADDYGSCSESGVLEQMAIDGDVTNMLPLVLTLLEESGWLATPTGRKAIKNAAHVCFEHHNVQLYEIFQPYASRLEESNGYDLLSALFRGDVEAAMSLTEKGERLLPAQILSQVHGRVSKAGFSVA